MYKNFAGYRDIKEKVITHSAELQSTADISEEDMHTQMRLGPVPNNLNPFFRDKAVGEMDSGSMTVQPTGPETAGGNGNGKPPKPPRDPTEPKLKKAKTEQQEAQAALWMHLPLSAFSKVSNSANKMLTDSRLLLNELNLATADLVFLGVILVFTLRPRSQNFKAALSSDLEESSRTVSDMKDKLVSDLARKLPVKEQTEVARLQLQLCIGLDFRGTQWGAQEAQEDHGHHQGASENEDSKRESKSEG